MAAQAKVWRDESTGMWHASIRKEGHEDLLLLLTDEEWQALRLAAVASC